MTPPSPRSSSSAQQQHQPYYHHYYHYRGSPNFAVFNLLLGIMVVTCLWNLWVAPIIDEVELPTTTTATTAYYYASIIYDDDNASSQKKQILPIQLVDGHPVVDISSQITPRLISTMKMSSSSSSASTSTTTPVMAHDDQDSSFSKFDLPTKRTRMTPADEDPPNNEKSGAIFTTNKPSAAPKWNSLENAPAPMARQERRPNKKTHIAPTTTSRSSSSSSTGASDTSFDKKQLLGERRLSAQEESQKPTNMVQHHHRKASSSSSSFSNNKRNPPRSSSSSTKFSKKHGNRGGGGGRPTNNNHKSTFFLLLALSCSVVAGALYAKKALENLQRWEEQSNEDSLAYDMAYTDTISEIGYGSFVTTWSGDLADKFDV